MFNCTKFEGSCILLYILLFLLINFVFSLLYKIYVNKHGIQSSLYCFSQFKETIFVSIPSYRDPDCPKTLYYLFEQSQCPERVFAGVFAQNAPEDDNVLLAYRKLVYTLGGKDFSSHIRVKYMDHTLARGPMYARAVIEQELFDNERYFFGIDSHSRFCYQWDRVALNNLSACPSEKAVLTMYPAEYGTKWNINVSNPNKGSYLRFKSFDNRGLPVIEGPQFSKKPSKPVPNLLWGACCSFSRSDMVKEVPTDPFCHYVFISEEYSRAARLYTHGWDLYAPKDMFVFQKWSRDYRPTFWDLLNEKKQKQKRAALETQGYARMFYILEMHDKYDVENPPNITGLSPGDSPYYGLGQTRSLEEFQQYCGVFVNKGIILPHGKTGISLNASEVEKRAKK